MEIGTACYIQKYGRTLMLLRPIIGADKKKDFQGGLYLPPGGHREPFDKSFMACAKREVREETGLRVKPAFRGVVTFDNSKRKFKDGKPHEDWEVHIFTANDYSGRLREDPSIGKLEWVLNSSLKILKIHEGDRLILDWIELPRVFDAKIAYKGESVSMFEVIYR